MERLRNGDEIDSSGTQSARCSQRDSILNIGEARCLIEHFCAGISRHYPPEVPSKRDGRLSASGGAIPCELTPGHQPCQVREQLVGVLRPTTGVLQCHAGEMIAVWLHRLTRGIVLEESGSAYGAVRAQNGENFIQGHSLYGSGA
jgi:hypothetical protein